MRGTVALEPRHTSHPSLPMPSFQDVVMSVIGVLQLLFMSHVFLFFPLPFSFPQFFEHMCLLILGYVVPLYIV